MAARPPEITCDYNVWNGTSQAQSVHFFAFCLNFCKFNHFLSQKGFHENFPMFQVFPMLRCRPNTPKTHSRLPFFLQLVSLMWSKWQRSIRLRRIASMTAHPLTFAARGHYSCVTGRGRPLIRYTAAEAPARRGLLPDGRTARFGPLGEKPISK